MSRRQLPDHHGGPVRATFDLVAPLANEATAMHTRDHSGAVSQPFGSGLRRGDVESANYRSPRRTPTTPSASTSTTATRTTTTSRTSTRCARFAGQVEQGHADFSFEELIAAYGDCRRTKRNTPSAQAFEQDQERNLVQLYDELRNGSYRPGRTTCFVIMRPKPREVWAAEYRDRVVHHLLYNHVAARFENSFIADSCACIPGRGTLYAARRLEAKVRSITQNWSRPAWYLKCDLANFFVSIDKRILRDLLARRIHEPWWLWLAETILFHDPRPGAVLHSPPARLALIPSYKSLFNQDADHGLPIGNLSSQFFANVYLDSLDQHVKHRLRARHYIRYVDDFLLLHESPQWLNAALAEIGAFLSETLGVRLNPTKTILQPVERGIDFVGQVIKPWRRTLRRRTFNEALHRVSRMDADNLFESANSYFGLLRQATHSHADRARLARIVRRRGHSVNRALTKIYRWRTTK